LLTGWLFCFEDGFKFEKEKGKEKRFSGKLPLTSAKKILLMLFTLESEVEGGQGKTKG